MRIDTLMSIENEVGADMTSPRADKFLEALPLPDFKNWESRGRKLLASNSLKTM